MPLVDLTKAVIVAPKTLGPLGHKAVQVLAEEVERRSRVSWPILDDWPETHQGVIALGLVNHQDTFPTELRTHVKEDTTAEGFQISAHSGTNGDFHVLLGGHDLRGLLYAVGRLLRELRTSRGRVKLPEDFSAHTSPAQKLRGHQLGYRPKTNAYDAWNTDTWDQYMRDLVLFGCNAIELIPPKSDDDADSPHFPKPPADMLTIMSAIADSYGLDVWMWFPAMETDYADPTTIRDELRDWANIFASMPRLDAVFVPGGDPGHTAPSILLDFLKQQAASLKEHHPNAGLWVSPQGFDATGVDEFYDYLNRQEPEWLTGVVFGPQCRMSLPALRDAIPSKYPIRRYPDITHSNRCQYPVTDWDTAYSLTQDREIINPRPFYQQHIFNRWTSESCGFNTYSEGCNDDVNKALWSALGWNPDTDILTTLRQYARCYISSEHDNDIAQGLLALEENWNGPLLTNETVYTTLRQFQAIERTASPQEKLNWRFQQLLYRAYYDAYLRTRLIQETHLEDLAMQELMNAERVGVLTSVRRAEDVLDRIITDPVGQPWRARVFELAEALFQSIGMQLSVPRYQAIAAIRGANLDLIDRPLNNREWLKTQFELIKSGSTEEKRLTHIHGVLNWSDPGPGGYYDDLGNPCQQPHLVRGPTVLEDPEYRERSLVGVGYEPGWRYSWCRHAEARFETPLRLEYHGLDPKSDYRVRVVYGGDRFHLKIRMLAGESTEIHPYITKPHPVTPLEHSVPTSAFAGGTLTLTWHGEPDLGGAGRHCQVAEVWVLKGPDSSSPKPKS